MHTPARRLIAVLAASAPLLLAQVVSGPGAGAASAGSPAASSSAASSTAPSYGVTARGAGRWTRVSTGDPGLLSIPAVLRTGDGVLHAVYSQDVGTSQQYEHATITRAGEVDAHHAVSAPWATLLHDPQLVPAPGGMRLVFSGLQDANTGNFFSAGRMYHALSDTTGASWTIPAEALTKSASAYASYGTAALALPDGSPFVAFVLNSAMVWRAGTIPAAALDPTLPDTVPADGSAGQSACCAYQTSLARSGDTILAAWYGNGTTADSEGILVRQLSPTPGPVTVAPGSNRPTGSMYDSFAPDQNVPLVTRPDGSIVAAYCQGTYMCEKLVLWQVGSGAVSVVPGAKGASAFDISVTPAGRIWVAFARSGKAYQVRTAPNSLRMGSVASLGAPRGADSLYRIVVDATERYADVIVNDGDDLSHLRVEPALTLRAAPRAWSGRRARQVTFKVTDAGQAVAGVRVRGGGETCRTNGSGVCRVTYGPRRPQRIKVSAKKGGYTAAAVKLKVRR